MNLALAIHVSSLFWIIAFYALKILIKEIG